MVIVVSHDRDFLDGLVDKMYEFRDGKVREHLGSVQDFLQKRKMETLHELERKQAAPDVRPDTEDKAARQQDFQQRRSESREQRKLKKQVAALEEEIDRIESEMKRIEAVLAAPGPEDDIMELTRSYLENKREADALTARWEKLSEQLES